MAGQAKPGPGPQWEEGTCRTQEMETSMAEHGQWTRPERIEPTIRGITGILTRGKAGHRLRGAAADERLGVLSQAGRVAVCTPSPVGLGHRRLSIIDIATGQQPLFNEDGWWSCVQRRDLQLLPAASSQP